MDQVEEVKSRVDIVEVISSYIPLKKAGRNFAALCPFHGEKTPSFMVSGERQVFKCFGCGESGDVFTFVEKMEGWDFREALEELAKRVGVKLRSFTGSESTKKKEALYKINKLAAKFYSHLLNNHPVGKKAREYLIGRGIGKSTWEKFELGFAPDGWEISSSFLKKRGFDFSDIVASGLVVSKGKAQESFYDRFRNRLIFPIKNSQGEIAGFSARVIGEAQDKQEPKYINTPETLIFNKGNLLYGLDLAKSVIRQKDKVLLVEGEFDVLSAVQIGVEIAVASKGTALTEKQVTQLSRLCTTVILGFDTDLAGDFASRRGIEMLDFANLNIKVLQLGKYKDPDEFCQKNPEGFKKSIEKAVNVYDFLIESVSRRFNPQTAEGKKQISHDLIPILAKINDDLVLAHYVTNLAKILDLEPQFVAEAIEKKSSVINLPDVFQKRKIGSSELYFLALFFTQDVLEKGLLKLVDVQDFEDEKCMNLWKWLRDIMKTSKEKSLKKILARVPKNLNEFVDSLFLTNLSPSFEDRELWAAEVIKIAKSIKQASFRRRLAEISKKLKLAQEEGNQQLETKLAKKFDDLSRDFRQAE